ncbi:MAG: beta-propeller domain-containing protein, partial [Solirubrobacteraceae bacterium]|nr:beta-propeller domain-containing protein [Solirubrobacteraceae bacterium]
LTLDLDGGTILRHGARLLIIGRKPLPPPMEHTDGGGVVPEDDESESWGTSRILEIDVSKARSPKLLRTLDVPGQVLASRQVGSTARVVVRTPTTYYGGSYKQRRWRLRHTTLRQIVPDTILTSAVSGDRYRRPLAECTSVARPVEFSGHQLLAILTVDLDRGLVGLDRDAVMGTPQVTYASTSALYVATARAVDATLTDQTYTRIHAFDTSSAGRTSYEASGRVQGLPVNQYAFSEDKGILRVATTDDPRWSSGTLARRADNRITTLRRIGSGLTQVGLVAGFGRGEQIKSVRYVGDRAYVVTFRETDPLFTFELGDPSAPRLLGEVKIPGYSGYLHVLGGGLVLGIGQNGTESGADRGAQVSLFDASDPTKPVRLAHRNLGGRGSYTDQDPHAFLWWPKRRMALVSYSDWGRRNGFVGSMVALQPSATGVSRLRELGRIRHGAKGERVAVLRAIVVGDRLLSVSSQGVLSSRLSDLQPTGYHRFDSRGFSPLQPTRPIPTPTPTGTTPTRPVGSIPGTTP